MKRIATLDAVFEACNALEEKGEAWDRDDVRAYIGGGSYSVIEPLIKTWRDHSHVSQQLPAMKAELLLSLSEWIEGQFSQKQTLLIDELRSNFSELELENQNSVSENQQLQQQVLELDQALANSQSLNKALQQEVDSLGGEVEQLSHQLEDARIERDHQQERAEQVIKDLHHQLRLQQQSAEQSAQETAAQHAANQEESDALKQQLSEAKEQIASQQQASMKAKDALATESARHQQALHELTIQSMRQTGELEGHNKQLQSELAQLSAMLERIDRERQNLLNKLLREPNNESID